MHTPLPSAADLLGGTARFMPLHHDAGDLKRVLDEFRTIPVSEKSAKTMADLARQLEDTEWTAAHHCARQALIDAREWAHQAGPELAADAETLEGLLRAQLPNADTLRAIRNPEFQARLQPFRNYLEQWSKSLRPWTELTQGRLNAEPKSLWPNHAPAGPRVKPSPPRTAFVPHVHGPGCGRDHAHSGGSSFSAGHEHDHGPKGFAAALPKGNAARWTLGGVGAAALGAIALNHFGKEGSERESNTEKSKTAQDRADDVAYTINHAISCGTTDVVLQPVIAATFGINVGCNHPDHHHPKEKLTLRSFAHEAGHYFKGEVFGDVVAVPLTIGVQRVFPNFMHGLRKLIEPLTGWAFRLGANHAAKEWGAQQGLGADAPEVAARAQATYEHEMAHLPQAVVWNMFAYPIGAFGQKAMGHGRTYPEIFKSKLVGAAVSNGMLIGGRMFAPAAAQKWDRFAGDNVVLPISKVVGRAFGVDERTMAEVNEPKAWEDRIANEPAPSTAGKFV